MSKQLGIVIVNYNTYAECVGCVESIIGNSVVDAGAIVIVDNHSPDGSGRQLAERLPGVRVILSDRNGGYAAGVNLGVANLNADYYLILNPDTRFRENTIGVAVNQFVIDPKMGVLGLHLEYADGSHQDSARRFFSALTILLRRSPLGRLESFRRILNEHLMKGSWTGGVFETDWVTGAAFIVRKTAFDAISGMDEGYFLYLEDTDLCKRMWRAGWTVNAIPSVRIVHFLQRDSAKSLFGKANRIFLRSLVRYFFKFGVPIWGHGSRR
jgi:N-acetylglucosaminyl-diphospho-decaprenol L-rhamnosyltransferase